MTDDTLNKTHYIPINRNAARNKFKGIQTALEKIENHTLDLILAHNIENHPIDKMIELIESGDENGELGRYGKRLSDLYHVMMATSNLADAYYKVSRGQ